MNLMTQQPKATTLKAYSCVNGATKDSRILLVIQQQLYLDFNAESYQNYTTLDANC